MNGELLIFCISLVIGSILTLDEIIFIVRKAPVNKVFPGWISIIFMILNDVIVLYYLLNGNKLIN